MLNNESQLVNKKNKMVYHLEYNAVDQMMGVPKGGVKIHTVDLEFRVIEAFVRKGAISLWRQ